jgi:hypothetical protein
MKGRNRKTVMGSINDCNTKTSPGPAHLKLSEIADMLDLTRERVRQIEAKALAKLRKNLNNQQIKLKDII